MKKNFLYFVFVAVAIGLTVWAICQSYSLLFLPFRKGDGLVINNKKLIIGIVPERNVFEQKRRYHTIERYLEEALQLDVQIKIMPSYEQITKSFIAEELDAGFFGSFAAGSPGRVVPLAGAQCR